MPEGIRPHHHWGVLLHGFLLHQLPTEIGDALHAEQTRPFSQYVEIASANIIRWHIGAWQDDIARQIVSALFTLEAITIHPLERSVTLQIVHTEHLRQTEEDFFNRFFSNDTIVNRYEIRFLTPTTHKSEGTYAWFPTPAFIYRSLAVRFSTFSDRFILDEAQVIKEMAEHTNITRYALRSSTYPMKASKISGYMGYVMMTIYGPESLKRLAGMLLSLGEYQGIGIKTALGMGGCRVIPQ